MIPQVPDDMARICAKPMEEPQFAISADHTLEGAEMLFIDGGAFMPTRRVLVIHFTNGASGRSSVDHWRRSREGICAHLVIERDGHVVQCRAFNRTAGHAGAPGRARWRDPQKRTLFNALNNCSIGIELANAGADPVALAWARRQPEFAGTTTAKHRNGGAMHEWENFPARQFETVTAIAKLLVARYRLDDITGHDCVAPERRDDPGPAFDMQRLREACGFTGLPEVFNK